MPVDFFNNNPTITSSATVANTSTESLISPLANNGLTEAAAATTTTGQAQTDPIFNLFGQPDGVLCKAILDSLSFYEKSSMISSLTPESGTSVTNNLNSSIEVLTNCLLMLKSAAANNPQYIDRIMGPFMKILQKLYRDHLNATGVLTSNVTTQVPASSTSLENSMYLFSSGTHKLHLRLKSIMSQI